MVKERISELEDIKKHRNSSTEKQVGQQQKRTDYSRTLGQLQKV